MSAAISEFQGAQAGPAAGLRVRPYRGAEDHPAMVRVNNRSREHAGSDERVTREGFDADYSHLTHCDPARDIVLAELDGAVVGYARTYWVDRSSGERTIELIFQVDPEARGLGLEGAFIDQLERRSVEIVAAEPTARPVLLAAHVFGRHPEGELALVATGFSKVRRECQLTRPNLDAIPDIPLPGGLEIRPIARDDEPIIARVQATDREVFSEHWGDGDDETHREDWAAYRETSSFDPTLWRVAFDGDEIAGQILNYLDPADADGTIRGWTESIAVRRPWRRRGLASALLAASLRAVRDRGATIACLGVDAQNPNQALTLYERLGFEIRSEMFEYQRTLRRVDAETAPVGVEIL
jgi:GNAT superfamily N-acetyltransferase